MRVIVKEYDEVKKLVNVQSFSLPINWQNFFSAITEVEDESDTDNETISKNFDTKKGKAIEHKMFLCGEYDDYYNDNNNDDNEDDDDEHHISR